MLDHAEQLWPAFRAAVSALGVAASHPGSRATLRELCAQHVELGRELGRAEGFETMRAQLVKLLDEATAKFHADATVLLCPDCGAPVGPECPHVAQRLADPPTPEALDAWRNGRRHLWVLVTHQVGRADIASSEAQVKAAGRRKLCEKNLDAVANARPVQAVLEAEQPSRRSLRQRLGAALAAGVASWERS